MAIEPSLENLQTRVLVEKYERGVRQKRLGEIKRELQEGAEAGRTDRERRQWERTQKENLANLKIKLTEMHQTLTTQGSRLTQDNEHYGLFGYNPKRDQKPLANDHLTMGVSITPDAYFGYNQFAPFYSKIKVIFDDNNQPVKIRILDTQAQLNDARQKQEERKLKGEKVKYTKPTPDGEGFDIITQEDDCSVLCLRHTTDFYLRAPMQGEADPKDKQSIFLFNTNGQLDYHAAEQLTQAVKPYLEIFQKPQINLTSK